MTPLEQARVEQEVAAEAHRLAVRAYEAGRYRTATALQRDRETAARYARQLREIADRGAR